MPQGPRLRELSAADGEAMRCPKDPGAGSGWRRTARRGDAPRTTAQGVGGGGRRGEAMPQGPRRRELAAGCAGTGSSKGALRRGRATAQTYAPARGCCGAGGCTRCYGADARVGTGRCSAASHCADVRPCAGCCGAGGYTRCYGADARVGAGHYGTGGYTGRCGVDGLRRRRVLRRWALRRRGAHRAWWRRRAIILIRLRRCIIRKLKITNTSRKNA